MSLGRKWTGKPSCPRRRRKLTDTNSFFFSKMRTGWIFSDTVILVRANGVHKGKSVKFRKNKRKLLFGTDASCDYKRFTSEDKASRHHFSVVEDLNNGTCWVKDEGSSRGTWIMVGREGSKREAMLIIPNMMFKCGKINFHVLPPENGAFLFEEQETKKMLREGGNDIDGVPLESFNQGPEEEDENQLFLQYRPDALSREPLIFKLPEDGADVRIGTSEDCEIRIVPDDEGYNESTNSVLSCIDGKWILQDADSGNGTWVKLSSSGTPLEINYGDCILCGYARFKVRKGKVFST